MNESGLQSRHAGPPLNICAPPSSRLSTLAAKRALLRDDANSVVPPPALYLRPIAPARVRAPFSNALSYTLCMRSAHHTFHRLPTRCAPCGLRTTPGCERRLAQLKALYNSTSGATWTIATNWDMAANSQCGQVDLTIPQGWPYYGPEMAQPEGPACIYKDPCAWDTKWHGVGCIDPCYAPTDGDNCVFGRVAQVTLRQNSLDGTIPEKFFDELINMTVVDLAFNSLSGTIPTELGKVRNLRTLDMNDNQLTGPLPTEIAHLGSALGYGYGTSGPNGLLHLDMSHNNLTGIIPSQIGYLENLQNLDLSANPNLGTTGIDGNQALNPGIPTQLGLLTNLKAISLDHCGFSGTVPTEVGELTQLQHFLLRGTTLGLQPVTMRLSGTLPTEIGKLSDVMHFGLGDNRISGTIPPQMGGMYMLKRWELQENALTGSMPDSFKDLQKLEWWDTYGNQMVGDSRTHTQCPDRMQSPKKCMRPFDSLS